MMSMESHAEASVELGAITSNIAALRAHVAPAAVMAVVKANGYGHGAVPAARAALRGGADWLGVVHVAEALEIRGAGIDVPLLCLMAIGSDDEASVEELAIGANDAASGCGLDVLDRIFPVELHAERDGTIEKKLVQDGAADSAAGGFEECLSGFSVDAVKSDAGD